MSQALQHEASMQHWRYTGLPSAGAQLSLSFSRVCRAHRTACGGRRRRLHSTDLSLSQREGSDKPRLSNGDAPVADRVKSLEKDPELARALRALT